MYRNLNTSALGITGRQSELIELALTYRFGGLDLDMDGIVKRARANGAEQARRFMVSAGIQGGEFKLPLKLTVAEADFQSGLVELAEVAEIAASLEAKCCRAEVPPVSDTLPYQEEFEQQRTRLVAVADVLAARGIRLGLTIRAAASHREGSETPFIHTSEALMTLIRTIGNPNVGLALDTWNWVVGNGSVQDMIAVPVETIVSVRLADIPKDADLGTITDDQRYMPGSRGQINCHTLVQHLIASEFAGPITLSPDSTRFAGMTRDAIVQQARATLDDLFNPNPPVIEEPVIEEPVATPETTSTDAPADEAATTAESPEAESPEAETPATGAPEVTTSETATSEAATSETAASPTADTPTEG